jgi:hypothetical protein
MKKDLLSIIIIVTMVIGGANAQSSLFNNISTTDQYHRFSTVQDEDGDGIYKIAGRDLIVKFNTKSLSTGEGYRWEAEVAEGDSKGKIIESMDAVQGYSTCIGYPYESVMKNRPSKEGLIAIGDYVFIVYNMSNDRTSFEGINDVFIKIKEGVKKEEVKKEETTKGKKKKKSMKDRLKALKELKNKLTSIDYGAAHKELESKNLDKFITDYLVAMKSKQNGRTSAEKRKDGNLEVAKKKDAAEIKAYNDKIKASPKYKKMKAHQKRMEEMDKGNNAKSVTIENKTGKDIYVYREGFRNGTLIRSNSSTKLNCSYNYTYKFDSNSSGNGSACYSANSRCGSRLVVN